MHATATAALTTLALILAGCAGGPARDSGDATPRVDADTYQLSIVGMNGRYHPGANVTVEMRITGSPAVQSPHIGAHYGRISSETPSTSVYDLKCNHVSGLVSGDKTFYCNLPAEKGDYYLRGHVAVEQDGQTINYWSPEVKFIIDTIDP